MEAHFATAAAAEPMLPGLWGLTPIAGMLGMLALLYWLLASGRIITKTSHEREIGIRDKIIARQDATIDKQSDQITSLLSVGKTVKGLLVAAGPDFDENTEAPVGGAT